MVNLRAKPKYFADNNYFVVTFLFLSYFGINFQMYSTSIQLVEVIAFLSLSE